MYIYEYIRSSQESLTDALFSNQINDGINKILERLDTIIANQGQILLSNRRIESNQNELINQNKKMIRSMTAIESNTEEAVYYSKLLVNYEEANTYFNYASYLERI